MYLNVLDNKEIINNWWQEFIENRQKYKINIQSLRKINKKILEDAIWWNNNILRHKEVITYKIDKIKKWYPEIYETLLNKIGVQCQILISSF